MLICLVSSAGVRKDEIISDEVFGRENQKSERYTKGGVEERKRTGYDEVVRGLVRSRRESARFAIAAIRKWGAERARSASPVVEAE